MVGCVGSVDKQNWSLIWHKLLLECIGQVTIMGRRWHVTEYIECDGGHDFALCLPLTCLKSLTKSPLDDALFPGYARCIERSMAELCYTHTFKSDETLSSSQERLLLEM